MFPFDSPEGLFAFNSLSIGAVNALAGVTAGADKENALKGIWQPYQRSKDTVAYALPITPTTPLNPSSEQSTTILLTGLPLDFKDRELVNLFAFAGGFENCTLSAPGSGLVRFCSGEDARKAIEVLNGKMIDSKQKTIIRADFTNLVSKPSRSMTIAVPGLRDPTIIEEPPIIPSESIDLAAPIPIPSGASLIGSCLSSSQGSLGTGGLSAGSIGNNTSAIVNGSNTQPIVSGSNAQSTSTIGSNVQSTISANASNAHSIQPSLSQQSTQSSLSQKQQQQQSLPLSELSNFQKSLIATGQLGSLAAVVGENFPCNTLYVGNLPPSAMEEELRVLFKHCFGYRRLSFKPKSSGPMCFVEFEDIACATAALETLYGTMLSCSNPAKGGIRLSYSKNPLGLRVASPVCDVSVLGNVHAVSSLIKLDSIAGTSNATFTMTPLSSMSSMSSMSTLSTMSSMPLPIPAMPMSTQLPNSSSAPLPSKSPLNLSPLMEIPEHRAAITNIMSHYNKHR